QPRAASRTVELHRFQEILRAGRGETAACAGARQPVQWSREHQLIKTHQTDEQRLHDMQEPEAWGESSRLALAEGKSSSRLARRYHSRRSDAKSACTAPRRAMVTIRHGGT